MTEPQELSEYEVEVNGNTTTMQLTEDDAKRLGAEKAGAKKKDAEKDADAEVANRGRSAADKARRPANG